MKPTRSVIFFTVSSGAGLGLLIALAFWVITQGVPAPAHLHLLVLGMALAVAGLVSWTLHLAKVKNAWRVFSRFKTSWLSREGVLAMALFPVAAIFAAMPNTLTASLLAAVALAVLVCTGMIYACPKPVPGGYTPLTFAGYVAMGFYSGALLALPVLAWLGESVAGKTSMVLVLLVISLAIKIIYYYLVGASAAHHTVQQALPLTTDDAKTIAPLDLGRTHGDFLTDELFFVMARTHARRLRLAALVLGFVIPAVALTSSALSVRALTFATLCCLVGLLAERWLFFAAARKI